MHTLSMGRRLSIGVLVGIIGAGLTACSTHRVQVVAGPPPAPSGVSVPRLEDTTGIVDGHCSAAAPARRTSPSGAASPANLPSPDVRPFVPVVARKMVLCRYNGMNESPRDGLRASRVIVGGAVVEQWRARFNRLRPVGPGPWSCPADVGSILRIAFVASPQSYVVLTADLSGCRFVSNGVEAGMLNIPPDDHFDIDLRHLVGG
jgi:hypothetical protein